MRALLVALALVGADSALAGAYVEGSLGLAGFVDHPVLRYGRHQSLGAGVSLRNEDRVIRLGGALAWSHHDGTHYTQQADQLQYGDLDSKYLTQGDSQLLSLLGHFDLAFLTHPGVGVGLRVDLGVGWAPLLMQRDEYNTRVVAASWDGFVSGLHQGIHPVAVAGPQLTWYTPSGVGVGLHPGVSFRSHAGLGYLIAVQLSWENEG